jgi:hypothetical protein
MRRLTITIAAALTVAATLTGCAATTGPAAKPPTEPTFTADAPTATPTPTETAVADPKAVTPAPTTSPSSPAAAPAPSALAQHIYDECSTGAAEAGVRLTFTEKPSGYPGANGVYQLIYPFTFLDAHTDPYAIYNCALTNDTITSTYVGGGLSDAH